MMLLPLALLLAAQGGATPETSGQGRVPGATIVAEPVALAIAGFDSDRDARTTRAEVVEGVARSFAAADTAKSGSLGYIAFADWALRWLGDRNVVPAALEVDRDGDGRITLPELQARFDAIFARLDRDTDGAITHAELLTLRNSATGADPSDRGRGERRRR